MPEIIISFGTTSVNKDRPNRGKSLLILPDTYVAIDIETTGFDTLFDEIIEVAAIRYVNNLEVARFQSLIKPKNSVGEFIETLTGITNNMLVAAPALESVLPKFREFVGSDLLVGHNVNFDVRFIYDYSRLLGLDVFSNDYVDTVRIARRVFPDLPNHKLETVCNRCGVPNEGAHRATTDCERVHTCLSYMKAFADEQAIDIRKSVSHNVTSKSLHAETTHFNVDSPIYGKTFAFTGKLEMGTRKEAMQAVLNAGGYCDDSVTQNTNYLVLGNNDYCKAIREGKSSKQKKAEKLQLQGFDIVTISETTFAEMLQDNPEE